MALLWPVVLPFALFPGCTEAGAFQGWHGGGIGTGGQVSFDATVIGHDGEASHVGQQQVAERLAQLEVFLLLTQGELLRDGAGAKPPGQPSPCGQFNIHHLHVIQGAKPLPGEHTHNSVKLWVCVCVH